MNTSQFQKIDPYDWFCGPGSHIIAYYWIIIAVFLHSAIITVSCKGTISNFHLV